MTYAIFALGLAGLVTGLRFKLKVLLAVLTVVFIGTLAYVFTHGTGVAKSFLIVMSAQAICQISYFCGILLRQLLDNSGRVGVL
jgi:hypothetical protein